MRSLRKLNVLREKMLLALLQRRQQLGCMQCIWEKSSVSSHCAMPDTLKASFFPPAALQALKRKKRYEKQLAQIDGTLSTIEFQREALENANTNTEVLKNMGYAAKAMKAAHDNMCVPLLGRGHLEGGCCSGCDFIVVGFLFGF